MYNPVRGGNRGGKDQFKWENVRTLAYKDRECYLGSTVAIGFLDKGGKWRKKDWWINLNKKANEDASLQEELRKIKEEDQRRLYEALGIAKKSGEALPQLSGYEMNELTKKIKKNDDLRDSSAEKIPGLGFESSKPQLSEAELEKFKAKDTFLAAEGIDENEKSRSVSSSRERNEKESRKNKEIRKKKNKDQKKKHKSKHHKEHKHHKKSKK